MSCKSIHINNLHIIFLLFKDLYDQNSINELTIISVMKYIYVYLQCSVYNSRIALFCYFCLFYYILLNLRYTENVFIVSLLKWYYIIEMILHYWNDITLLKWYYIIEMILHYWNDITLLKWYYIIEMILHYWNDITLLKWY